MAAPVPAAATDRPAMPAISFVCFIESFPRRERDGAAGDRTSEGSRDPVIRGHYKRGGGGSPALFDTRRQDAHVPLAANPGQVSRVVPSRRASHGTPTRTPMRSASDRSSADRRRREGSGPVPRPWQRRFTRAPRLTRSALAAPEAGPDEGPARREDEPPPADRDPAREPPALGHRLR